MRPCSALDTLRFALLAALGAAPVAACGGTEAGRPRSDPTTQDASAPPDALALPDVAVPDASDPDVYVPPDPPDAAQPDASPSSPFPCRNPTEVLVNGMPTGLVTCDQGAWTHRQGAVACPSVVPRSSFACPLQIDGGGRCATDLDCSAGAYCNESVGLGGCFCTSACSVDSDCPSGMCLCGQPAGSCALTSGCTVDAQCGAGLLCVGYAPNPGCPGTAFACQTPRDTCVSDTDCPSAEHCLFLSASARFECEATGCAVGRPFLVGGIARTAEACDRGDWVAAGVTPEVASVPPALRTELAARWAALGRMEHASIAAFARFSLQLLALGAPPDLLVETQRATADEVEHAALCFAMASAYAGRSIGPGRLATADALAGDDAASVVETLIREGCVGETLAAAEAGEAASLATDAVVRATLIRIERDELRHAALAWRALRWLLESGGDELRGVARHTFEAVASERPREASTPTGADLRAYGLLGDDDRASLSAAALARVVVPCAERLLGPPGGAPASAAAV